MNPRRACFAAACAGWATSRSRGHEATRFGDTASAARPPVIRKVGRALKPRGHFLFSAPAARCTSTDMLAKRLSIALRAEAYRATRSEAGLDILAEPSDEGDYHDESARKRGL